MNENEKLIKSIIEAIQEKKGRNIVHVDLSGIETAAAEGCGSIVVIENVFHFKQVLPLRLGNNVIGRYQKGNPINTAFETVDPSVDLNHCTINVSRDKRGGLRYTLMGWTARLLSTWTLPTQRKCCCPASS